MADINDSTVNRLEKSIDKLSTVVEAWPDKVEAKFATKESVSGLAANVQLEFKVRDEAIDNLDDRITTHGKYWFWLVTTVAGAIIGGLITFTVTLLATRGHL